MGMRNVGETTVRRDVLFVVALVLSGLIVAVVFYVLRDTGPGELAYRRAGMIEQVAFAQPDAFETGQYSTGSLRIVDGQYVIHVADGLLWGQGGVVHDDVVVEVVAQSEAANAGYGVMCRADPANTGGGYLFLVSPNGEYLIASGEDGRFRVLTSGTAAAGIINAGANLVRAVCIRAYLALYVNETFLASVADETHLTGLPGLAARLNDDRTLPITAMFDDLAVFAARLEQAN